ncbi:hypothetical protein CSUI_000135 [Cystoisospora suis]|uniref:DUF4460 domain-containing protein n=1 Tax=Cystoisospora suis TaxID=483139 RepID=A0A2C6LGW4_9APIC|nr:hypothetical protein CSUI_000135 [Cystoisospora suis]
MKRARSAATPAACCCPDTFSSFRVRPKQGCNVAFPPLPRLSTNEMLSTVFAPYPRILGGQGTVIRCVFVRGRFQLEPTLGSKLTLPRSSSSPSLFTSSPSYFFLRHSSPLFGPQRLIRLSPYCPVLRNEVRGETRGFISSRQSSFRSVNRRTDGKTHPRGTKASLRRELRFFLFAVHPDQTHSFPEEARASNSRSLSELNAYIDKLENLLTSSISQSCSTSPGAPALAPGEPFVGKKLLFFVPYKTVSGNVLEARVRPVHVHLRSIGLSPPRSEIENLAEE